MTILVALAPLIAPSFASETSTAQDAAQLRWDWSRTHRFAIETQVQLPLFMWFATPYNRQARVTGFDLRLVTRCGDAQIETKRVTEITCDIEDIALSAAGMPQEKGLLQPILTELDEILTDASVQLRMNDEGHVVNIDLEGLDRRNLRIGRLHENMRLVLTRAFAGFDLQLDSGDSLQWAQYDNWLLYAPSATGTAGSAQVVHTRSDRPVDGFYTIRSGGRALIVPGEGANRFDARIVSDVTFDTRLGRIVDRTWTVLGAPTASSYIAAGTAGYPYAQQGRMIALTEAEPWDVGDSVEYEPNGVQTAIQQSMHLGTDYPIQ